MTIEEDVQAVKQFQVASTIDFEKLKLGAENAACILRSDKLLMEQFDSFQGHFTKDYTLESAPHFKRKRFIPMPDILLQQLDKLQSKCFMGIFSEIQRVWLTIDNRLFLWNYEDKEDFSSFEGISEVIMSVALARPKADVFIDEIEYLLIVATPLKIYILGWMKTTKNLGKYQIIDTKLVIGSNDTGMLSIVGGNDGRIFMCGSDGNLYELEYQSEEGWFSKKCRKLNRTSNLMSYLFPTFLKFTQDEPLISLAIDNSRQLLFSLSLTNTLQVFTLKDGVCKKLCKITDIYTDFLRFCPQSLLFKKEDFRIVSIHAITASESFTYNLLAVSSSGIRLYFYVPYNRPRVGRYPKTTYSTGEIGSNSSCELVHVRLPFQSAHSYGGSVDSGGLSRPFGLGLLQLHTAYSNRGIFLAAHSYSDEEDVLWQVDRNYFPSPLSQLAAGKFLVAQSNTSTNPGASNRFESHSTLSLKGKTWAIVEAVLKTPLTFDKTVPDNSSMMHNGQFKESVITSSLQYHSLLDNLSPYHPYFDMDFLQEQREFLILSHNGILVLEHISTLRLFQDILLSSSGLDNPALTDFVVNYSATEVCYMTILLLLHSQGKEKGQYGNKPQFHSNWNNILFSLLSRYGSLRGEKSHQFSSPSSNLTTQPLVLLSTDSTPGASLLPFGSSRVPTIDQPSKVVSPRSHALYLYVTRLVRRIWKIPFSELKDAQEGSRLIFTVLLQDVHVHLCNMLNLLKDENISISMDLPGTGNSWSTTGQQREKSINGSFHPNIGQRTKESSDTTELLLLRFFVEYMIQALRLLLLILDHPLELLIQQLPMNLKNAVVTLHLDGIISSQPGYDILIALVSLIVQRQIVRHRQADALIDILAQRCPWFFHRGDYQYYKAFELLCLAKHAALPAEKKTVLRDAVALLEPVAYTLTLDRLSTLVDAFRIARCHPAAIRLTLKCLLEVSNIATGSSYSGYSPNIFPDPPGSPPSLYKDSAANVVNGLVSPSLGTGNIEAYAGIVFGLLDDAYAYYQDAAENSPLFSESLHAALESPLESYHIRLYDWMIAQGWFDLMTSCSSPFLEEYLLRYSSYDSLANINLLWKFYVHHKQFDKAAESLLELANGQKVNDISLRLEYLSLALVHAKAFLSSSAPSSLYSSRLSSASSSEADKRAFKLFVDELAERNEIAEIQYDIFQKLESSNVNLFSQDAVPPISYADEIAALHSNLYSLSDLYNIFAVPLGLHEHALKILHLGQYADEALVASHWSQFLTQIIDSTSVGEAALKIISLGRCFLPQEFAFPIRFLIGFMERMAFQHIGHVAMYLVPHTFVEADVEPSKVWEELLRLLDSKDSPWNLPEAQKLLLEDLVWLLTNHIPVHGQYFIDSKTISRLINQLNLLDPSHPGLAKLRNYLDLQQR